MWIIVDVESDGPYPPKYSMICFGAVTLDGVKWYGRCRPISEVYIPDALEISGFTREQTEGFVSPETTMKEFARWVKIVSGKERAMFISDNNGYDWQFMNYYLWEFAGENPFGHSSTNLGSLYKGLVKDTKQNFKHLRKTTHTHNPVDDCLGNIEALRAMIEMGLKF